MEIDLHGYGPNDIVFCDVFQKIISQAWEIGAEDIYFIHGHGRN